MSQADMVQIIFPDNTVHIVEPTELKNLRNMKGFPYPINHVRGVDGIAHSEDNFQLQPGAKYNVSGPSPLEGNRGAPAIIDMKSNTSKIDGKSAGTMIVNKKPAVTQKESAIVTKTPPSARDDSRDMRKESTSKIVTNKMENTKNMIVDKAKEATDAVIHPISNNEADRVPTEPEYKTTFYFKSLAGAPLYKETPSEQRKFLITFIASIGIGMWAFRKGYNMRKIMISPGDKLNKIDTTKASLTPREKDHIQQANKWMLGGLGGVLSPVAYLLYKWSTGGNRTSNE